MPETLEIEAFLSRDNLPIIDVRSPGEFEKGHLPGAWNIPLFDNEERAVVGTLYKKKGKELAIQEGYEIVQPKLPFFLAEVGQLLKGQNGEVKNSKEVLVHCWRGGMRSAKFAEFLNENGFRASTLNRGYKAYRRHVLDQFEQLPDFVLLGGETGSGKTELLKEIEKAGESFIDLEALARHKGSAFGALGEADQPSQEQFENDLAEAIKKSRKEGGIVWLEDESRTIGTCRIPDSMWFKMKEAPILRVQIPKENRINRLVKEYGHFSREELARSILKIKKRLGPQHAKRALEELDKGNLAEVVEMALVYYDKAYNYCHELRDYKDVYFVECDGEDMSEWARKVIEFHKKEILLSK